MPEKDWLMILDSEAEQAGDQLEQAFRRLIKKIKKEHALKEFLITTDNHKIIYVMEIGPMIFMPKNWITMLEKVWLMILDLEVELVGDLSELAFHKLIWKNKINKKDHHREYLITTDNHKISYAMETGLMIFMPKNWITMPEKGLQMILDSEAEPAGDQLELVSLKLINKIKKEHALKEFHTITDSLKTIYAMEIGPMIFMQKN